MNDHKEFLNIKQSFDVPDLREGSLVFPATRGWLCLWVSDIFFFFVFGIHRTIRRKAFPFFYKAFFLYSKKKGWDRRDLEFPHQNLRKVDIWKVNWAEVRPNSSSPPLSAPKSNQINFPARRIARFQINKVMSILGKPLKETFALLTAPSSISGVRRKSRRMSRLSPHEAAWGLDGLDTRTHLDFIPSRWWYPRLTSAAVSLSLAQLLTDGWLDGLVPVASWLPFPRRFRTTVLLEI